MNDLVLPKYLSPSAISNFLNNPYTALCTRLLPKEMRMKREPQNLAMGVGTMFDIMIKEQIINTGIRTVVPMEKIAKALQNEDIRIESTSAADTLMKTYNRSRVAMSQITPWHQIEGEYEKDYTFPYKGKPFTLRLLGKLDAIVKDKDTGMICVLDWKCSGYSSASGATPAVGYENIYDSKNNKWVGPHKTFKRDMCVLNLKGDWARQFSLYAIMLNEEQGLPFGTDVPVFVHHPIFNGKNKTPKIAKYRVIATKKAQTYFWEEACALRESLENGEYIKQFKGDMSDPMFISACGIVAKSESFFMRPKPSANEMLGR